MSCDERHLAALPKSTPLFRVAMILQRPERDGGLNQILETSAASTGR